MNRKLLWFVRNPAPTGGKMEGIKVRWLFSDHKQQKKLEVVRQHAAQLMGADALEKALSGSAVQEQLQQNIRAYELSSEIGKISDMPQAFIKDQTMYGGANSVDQVKNGLKRKQKKPGQARVGFLSGLVNFLDSISAELVLLDSSKCGLGLSGGLVAKLFQSQRGIFPDTVILIREGSRQFFLQGCNAFCARIGYTICARTPTFGIIAGKVCPCSFHVLLIGAKGQ